MKFLDQGIDCGFLVTLIEILIRNLCIVILHNCKIMVY